MSRRIAGRSVPWRAVVGVVAILVGVVVGAVLRGEAEPSTTTATPRPRASHAVDESTDTGDRPTSGSGPDSPASGVGAGLEHSEAGAIAAAVSYATASQSWMYLSDEDAAAAVEAVVVPGVGDGLVERVVDGVRLLRDELQEASGTVWFVVAPLATRLDAFSSSHAVVRVWVVQVLAAEGIAVPQSGWQTLTLDLQWHGGDWRVADVAEAEGPTPQLEAGLRPWAADLLEETLSGFVRVGLR